MSKDIGIDLGTSNTVIYVRGRGIRLSEPSVVAVNVNTRQPIVAGSAAERMIGRTPENIIAVRPVREGVIADFELAEYMLKQFVTTACGFAAKIGGCKMLISVPSKITEVEQLAVLEAAKRAAVGAKPRLIEEPLAAAIGAELPLGAENAMGSMIVDIGGGTSEIAVLSMGGIIKGDSVKIAGERFDTAIMNYLKQEYNLLIGEKTAERVKREIGTAYPGVEEVYCDVRGRDLISGLPSSVRVSSSELIEPLKEPVMQIVNAVKSVLDGLDPEISADIAANGIVLTGGGALLNGLAEVLRIETNVPVRLADSPLECVAVGTGMCLSESRLRALINENRR